MSGDQNRPCQFPPNVDRFLPEKKGCKRPVYKGAYYLLTPAYFVAYIAAYLLFTEKAGKGLISQIWLVLRAENIASPGASCWFFQN